MPPIRPRTPSDHRLNGVVVWLLVALVFGLGLLSVSPNAHAHLHADHAHDEAACAVTLFQQGITTPLAFPQVGTPGNRVWIATLFPAREALALSAPRHLFQLARGPPRSG
jgi:hypothetical protein